MQFKYLNADEIGRFEDCFKDDLLLKSGLSFDEISTLSKREFNEMINIVYKDEPVNENNIHLYYEFMSSLKKCDYGYILTKIFTNRFHIINDKIILNATSIKYETVTSINYMYLLSQSIYGVEDTLKPIDDYITEIKDSSEYKEYIASLA